MMLWRLDVTLAEEDAHSNFAGVENEVEESVGNSYAIADNSFMWAWCSFFYRATQLSGPLCLWQCCNVFWFHLLADVLKSNYRKCPIFTHQVEILLMERVWAQIRLKFNLNIGSILNILNILDNFECWNIFYIESIFFYSDDTKLQAMRHISDSDCLKDKRLCSNTAFD